MSYDQTISFRATGEEKVLISSLATTQGMSISDFVRSRVLEGQPLYSGQAQGLASYSTSAPSSTPQAVYAALEPRLSQLEEQIQRATSYIREDEDGNSN